MPIVRVCVIGFIAVLLASGCSGDDDAAEPTSTTETVTTTTVAATSSTTSTNGAESLPARAEPCERRETDGWTPEEFPFDPPEPSAEPVVPGAERRERRGPLSSDPATRSTGIVAEPGWARLNDGIPTLFRVLEDDDPEADPLTVIEDCPLTGDFVVTANYLVAPIENPQGVVVVDLDTGDVVHSVDVAGFWSVTAVDEAREPGVWLALSDTTGTVTLHRFDPRDATLTPPLYEPGQDAGTWNGPTVVDNAVGTVVAHNDQLDLFDPDSGDRLAPTRELESDFALLGGNDQSVWLWSGGSIVTIDSTSLEEVDEAPIDNLVYAAYGEPYVWYTTLEPGTLNASLGTLDIVTGERRERAAFTSYEAIDRGGPYDWFPRPRPIDGGAVYFDERAFAEFFIPAE